MRRLLGLLILFMLLAPALPVKAETSYYALSFDGEDDYVEVSHFEFNEFTILTLISISKFDVRPIGQDYSYSNDKGWNIRIDSNGKVIFEVGSAGVGVYGASLNTVMLVGGIYDDGEIKAVLNTQVSSPITHVPASWGSRPLQIMKSWWGTCYPGKVYLVLFYSRALSDEEIQAIYNDPLHPPTDGLEIFYAPDSVDTTNGVWQDKSGNSNDGTIYGASYVPLRPVSESTPSASSPYALSFDGDDYIEVNNFITGNFSGITLVVFANYSEQNINKEEDRYVFEAWNGVKVHIARTFTTNPTFYVWNGSAAQNIVLSQEEFGTYDGIVMQAFVADTSTQTLSFYKNAQLIESKSVSLSTISLENPTLTIMRNVIGKAYLILFYTRALSNDEIKQIYENPNNPPLDGLVLWLDPYSYDPESGKWLNRAPIFPTVPLVEMLDGQNYGATAERVVGLKFNVYDAYGNKVSGFTVTDLKDNVTSYVPLFWVPYSLEYKLFNVSVPNLGLYSVVGTTPNADKEIWVNIGGWWGVGNLTITEEFSQGMKESLGGSYSVGIFALFVVLALSLASGASIGTALAINVPLVVGLARSGYLPMWMAYVAIVMVGVLTVYIVWEMLGGRDY